MPLRLIIILSILFFVENSLFSQAPKVLPADKQKQITEYTQKCTEFEKNSDFRKASSLNSKMAIIYWNNQLQQQAIDHFLKAAALLNRIQPPPFDELKTIYTNVGVVYTQMENLDEALLYFNKSLDARKKLVNGKEAVASGMVDIAYILISKKDFKQALEVLNPALDISTSINNAKLILSCYNLLSKCYTVTGNNRKSQEFQDKYNSYLKHIEDQKKDEQFKEESDIKQKQIIEKELEKQAEQLKFDLAMTRKKAEENLLRYAKDSAEQVNTKTKLQVDILNKENALREAKVKEQELAQKRQQTLIYGLIAVILLIAILVFLIILRMRERRKNMVKLSRQNEEINMQKNDLDVKNTELEGAFQKIEKQNIEIISSIVYASRIQMAIIPPADLFTEYLPDSFILFRPRDIVSGDYYWFTQVSEVTSTFNPDDGTTLETNIDKVVVSAIDCTGHGVPGALLSMVADNLLHQIVMKDNIHDPGTILDKINRGVRKILKQDTSKSRDGMDMSICLVSPDEKKVTYSGAKGGLVFVKNNQLEFFKGDFEGIGGLQVEQDKKYESIEIIVDQPTEFYQFSDGYMDQFGGEFGKKLMSRNFRDTLLSVHEHAMTEQKLLLEQKFDTWRGRFEQIDDVLVIGYRIT